MEEELVLRIINEKLEYEHIAPEWLCDGICTRSEYDEYCTGEMDIDYLTLEMMLERLGMNSMDFISWVDYDVYEYLEWRDKNMEAIRNKDTVTLRQLLYSDDMYGIVDVNGEISDREEKRWSMNPKLIMQFGVMAVSMLEWFEGRRKNAERYARQAVEYTGLGNSMEFEDEDTSMKMLSDKEIAMNVLSDYFEVENNLENNAALERTGRHLGQMLRYIDGNGRDIRSVALLFPYISYLYVRIQIMLGRAEQGIAPCKRSIELMRTHNQCRMLEMTLRQYIQLMENLGISNRAQDEERLLKSWQEVLGFLKRLSGNVPDEGCGFAERLLRCGVWNGGAFVTEGDIIKLYRAREGITQKRLSIDADYSMRSMWLIENSKAKPQKNGYEKIRKRLGIPSGHIHSDIYCTSYKAYMLKYQLERAMMNLELEKADGLLDKLEKELIRAGSGDEVKTRINKQFIMDSRNAIAYTSKKITAKEYLERSKKCLALTVDIENKKIDKVFLRVEELLIIIHIAQAYSILGNTEKAVQYSKIVIDYCESRNIKSQAYINKMLIAYHSLASDYRSLNKYDESLEYITKGMFLDISSGKGKLVATFIFCYAYSQEKFNNNLEALNAYQIVINACEIFGNSNRDKAVSNYTWLKNKIESEYT